MDFAKPLAVHTTNISGVLVFDLTVHGDSRGWFKENWQRAKMLELGLPDFGPVQNNISYNEQRGVTRGVHAEPWDKLISVASGKIFGAWVDLRPGASFGELYCCEIDSSKAIYVPRGVGNAYQALEDGTIYTYLVNAHWSAEQKNNYTFVNLADPDLNIPWPIPLEQTIRSEADLHHPALADIAPMKPRRTLVVGSNGQLGRALQEEVRRRNLVGWEFHDVTSFDICNPADYKKIDWDSFGTIINAAAYTAVDKAETLEGRRAAWNINVAGVALLSRAAAEHHLTLVHISSDYVFDGEQEVHSEDEDLSPLGVYGQTKAAADMLVTQLTRHYLVRASWVIGDGKNFVRTMMGLSRRVASGELSHVRVVDDQIGRLTFTDDMAQGILWLLGYREGDRFVDDRAPRAVFGTYNLSGSGASASWADIATRIFDLTEGNGSVVQHVSTKDYFSSVQGPVSARPHFSTLQLDKLAACGFVTKNWEQSLTDYIQAQKA